MFYYYYGIAPVHKLLEDSEQDLYVFAVQPGCGFVKYIEGVPCAFPPEFGCQFHPLAFSSRKGDCGLPEPYVSESHIHEGLQFLCDGRDIPEKAVGFVNGHFQDIVDILSFILYGKGVFLISASPAFRADYIDRRQEIHLDDLYPCSLAFFAASSGYVEREPSGLEAPHFRIRCVLEQLSDVVEYPGECCRIASRCSPYRALVDFYQFVDVFDTDYAVMRERLQTCVVEFVFEHGHERFVDKG